MPERLRLCWTYRVKPWARRQRERALMFVAWRLPKPLVYWAFIRLATVAVHGNESPSGFPVDEVLRRTGDWA